MSDPALSANPLAEARLAIRLFLRDPLAFGGLCLRGSGPARDRVLAELRESLPQDMPWLRLPGHIDDDRLLGGVDVVASLAAGRAVHQAGLLERAAGGVITVPMAERLREDTAGRLAQALDTRKRFALVLLDDGIGPDERIPAALSERVAFHCDLSGAIRIEDECFDDETAIPLAAVASCFDEQLSMLAGTGLTLGINSARAMLFATLAARASAACEGRGTVELSDLETAARLVLAPRATRCPPDPGEEATPPSTPADDERTDDDADRQMRDEEPEDIVLEAALAAIPPDVLERIGQGQRSRSMRGGGGAGKRTKSKLRGKPLGARPGVPGGGAQLALIDTLRTAAPWQPLRKSTALVPREGMDLRKDDLRIRRFEERSPTVTVFCVDASGSAALARLAEAKGAVELILAQAYVKRSEVALIAFRGTGADLLLAPTRSLTRARRALAELPGGGGTPLAAGVAMARQLGLAIAARGATPLVVFLTDGSGNIAMDGTPGRAQAREDAMAAGRQLGASGLDALVIDISPRPRPEAEQLAQAMRGRYLPLPFANAAGLERAVAAAQNGLAIA
ncbi:MAG: magnesium chelatase subunit D [Sphingomonadaceae bacterium]